MNFCGPVIRKASKTLIFTTRSCASATRYACLSVCPPSVRPSVTSRSSTKMVKSGITQTTPYDSPGTRRSARSSPPSLVWLISFTVSVTVSVTVSLTAKLTLTVTLTLTDTVMLISQTKLGACERLPERPPVCLKTVGVCLFLQFVQFSFCDLKQCRCTDNMCIVICYQV